MGCSSIGIAEDVVDGLGEAAPGLPGRGELGVAGVSQGVDAAGGAAGLGLPFALHQPLALQSAQGGVEGALADREGLAAAALDLAGDGVFVLI